MTSFDQALVAKPDDYSSLHNKGVTLSRLDRDEEAIALFDQVLTIKPDDLGSLRDKGAALSFLQRYTEAIPLLTQVLRVVPDDARSHYWLGKCAEKQGDIPAALDHYELFVKHARSSQDDDLKPLVRFKLSHLAKPTPTPSKKSTAPATTASTTTSQGTDVLYRVLEALDPGWGGKFMKGIAEARQKLEQFTSPDRSIPADFRSFLSVLRKWNSYTPVLPSQSGDNQGGGYFLFHKGKGIVIDPGFNFVENFYSEGFKVADIDAVLITHAHNDHTVDLESILSLLYKLNTDRRDKEKADGTTPAPDKKIDLLINAGTFMKYSGWLSLKTDETNNFVNTLTVLHPGMTYDYAGLKIHATRAKHHEIISSQYCIGCVIEADDPEGFKVGFTSDTGWEPDGSIAQQYIDHKPDLMIAHLGSIKEKEFKFDSAETDEEKQDCYYKFHLGILGLTNFLEAVRPKLTVLSEFGEELRDVRREIAKALEAQLGINCLPGDIGLHISLHDLGVLCFVEREFVPFSEITIQPTKSRDETNLMYHKKVEAGPDFMNALDARDNWRRRSMDKKLQKT